MIYKKHVLFLLNCNKTQNKYKFKLDGFLWHNNNGGIAIIMAEATISSNKAGNPTILSAVFVLVFTSASIILIMAGKL